MVLPQAPFALLVYAACLTFAASATGHADSRPTRGECIIGFRLDWSKVRGDRHEIRRSLLLGSEGARRIQAQPAMTISPDGTRLYLQFRRNCEKKDTLAAEVIAFWRSKGLDLPQFERINEPITPSPDTIEVWGPSWRDKPKDTRGENK